MRGYLKSEQDRKEFDLLFKTLSQAQQDQLKESDFYWCIFNGRRPHKYEYMAWRLKILKKYIQVLNKRPGI